MEEPSKRTPSSNAFSSCVEGMVTVFTVPRMSMNCIWTNWIFSDFAFSKTAVFGSSPAIYTPVAH